MCRDFKIRSLKSLSQCSCEVGVWSVGNLEAQRVISALLSLQDDPVSQLLKTSICPDSHKAHLGYTTNRAGVVFQAVRFFFISL